jgi:ligand-binding SRPBCC domain-containing protein
MTRRYRLVRTQLIPRLRDEAFGFFSDAKNLERITPEFLNFHIISADHAPVYEGMLIDYRLRLCGIPLRWQSRIESFDPPNGFCDVQTRGPYRYWRHVHRFQEAAGGTQMIDEVEYELPFGVLGSVAHALFVRRMLQRIFDYRQLAVGQYSVSPHPEKSRKEADQADSPGYNRDVGRRPVQAGE